MKVAQTQIVESAVSRASEQKTENADSAAFKAALAKASTTETNGATTEKAEITLRKGEQAEAVEGHAYSEITKGAREGMYVNTSGNVRHGEAFVLVHKQGIEHHIYGSGADREVIALEPRKKRDDD